jgi:hypothetical protein
MKVLRELLNSKKFVASLIGLVTAVAVKLGAPETAVEELVAIVSPMLVYAGAQGFADLGKERERLRQPENLR